MSIIKPTTDKKDMASSLSADAAEFVPQCGAPQHANSPTEALSGTPQIRWKGQKPVEVTQVPRYLTSCYPFVSPEDIARHHISRFSQHCPYTGGMPPTLPIPVTPPIRFPTWQPVKPGFVENFQSASYGSMSFDLLASLPMDMFNLRGDGLLPIPSKMGVTAPSSSGQGMLLTAHPDSASSWIMTVPPPMFLQQQQQLHTSQQQPHLTVTTNTTTTATYLNATVSTTKKLVDEPKMIVKSGSQRDVEQPGRPQSPVLISRSTQTDLPGHIHNFTLEERPHPFYGAQARKDKSALSRSGINCDGHEWKAEHEDSDSGYNSPMHKQNLVSSGTQVIPSRIPSGGNSRLMETAHNNVRSQKSQENSDKKLSASIVGKSRTDGRECVKSDIGNCLDESIEVDGKKKRRKKKDERYTSRSPRLLGSNTKLLSRSSSSLSSSGTRPDEDDEKIDLHSWTDFPPMSSRGAPLSASSKSLKSTLTVAERVPLMIERSAHEPPWSIKFSSVDQTRSEQSRSPSGEKDTILSSKSNLAPESAWGKIGRSFKNSQASALGKELSLLMTNAATVPLLSSGGKTSARVSSRDSDSSTVCSPVPSLKGPSVQTNRSNTPSNRINGSGRGAHKHSDDSKTNVKSLNDSQSVNGVYRNHTEQGKKELNVLKSTVTGSTNPVSSSTKYSSVSPASLSPRPVAGSTIMTTTTSASNMSFAGVFATKTTTVSPNNDNVLSKPGPHLQANVSLPYTSLNSSHAAAHGMPHAEASSGVVSIASSNVGVASYSVSNPMTQNCENNRPGAANCSTFVRVGSVTSNQPASSSSSSTISLTSLLQQSPSFINSNMLPVGVLRPVFPGAPPSVNYHIPPPAQGPLPLHPTGSSYPAHPLYTSYANITQGCSARTTSAGFLTRGATSQTVHQVASPFQNSNVPFIPSSHTFPPSTPCPYFPGIVTYQPPGTHASGMVPTSLHSLSDLVLQPQNFTAANVSTSSKAQKSSDLCMPTIRSIQHQVASHASNCVSSNSKMADVGTRSTVNTSLQQQFNDEQSPLNILDVALNSRTVEDSDKRRRRRRKRTRGRKGGKDTEEGDGESDGLKVLEHSTSNVSESTLHFEDLDEFPDLLTSATHGHAEDISERATLSGTSVTYSDILRSTWSKAGSQSRTQSLTGSCVSGDIDDEDNASCHTGTTNESKRARKRRKRREQANKAAEAELAEISLEQQWLKEVGLKKSANHRAEGGVMGVVSGRSTPGLITDSYVISEAKRHTDGKGSDKKSQQPIAFDIAAMIDAIQKKPMGQSDSSSVMKSPTPSTSSKVSKKEQVITNSASSNVPGNMLDSSAPLQKRGKEREIGKSKKPSPLKKVILKEREQRKRLRLLDEDPDSAADLGAVGTSSGVGMVGGESELSQDALSNKSGDTDGEDTNGAAELSADFSPISQTSPISMSPASPGNSGVNSPITGSLGRDPVVMKIHSRRFREYCTQILDKEIDQCCTSLLQDLVKFQDRMYHKDPVKAKTKRRVVLGLREVTKHLKLKKIKCVVISPNLEKIQSKGGLDEALNNILNMCREQDVPFVFALGRRALGRACAKLVPVSVVGIFNYEGCESKYRSLISLTAAARTAYNEMVLAVEKEVAEYPTIASQTSSIGGVPGLFAAHMGHSRTPSGCSAISFTSSILSEPISENFPHAEPEVDSKGYEIVRDAAGNVVHPSGPGVSSKLAGHAGLTTDIDDGNEADIEDFCEMRRKRRGGRPVNSVRFGDIGYVNDCKTAGSDNSGKDKNCDTNVDGASDDADERSTIGKLSRNVSELTLTNEDNFILKGEPYALKRKSSLQDFDDDREEFDDDKDMCNDGAGKTDQENIYGDHPESSNYSKWVRVSHIDSIHSQSYNLGDDIFSHHSSQSHDLMASSHSVSFASHSQLSPSSLIGVGGTDGHHTGQKSNFDGKDDDVDNDIDNEDDIEEENENEATERHHRVIDKERIKNWLESQSNISTED